MARTPRKSTQSKRGRKSGSTSSKARGRQAKRKSNKGGRRRRSWFGRLLPYLVLLVSIGCAVLGGYAIYLDGQIRTRFEGVRWTLPAKVYASPLTLYAGLDMSRDTLVAQLQRQGYRPSDDLDTTGTYRTGAGTLDIHVREFNYWDKRQPARRIRLAFGDQGVTDLTMLDDREDLSLLRLDPQLIGSIYPTQGPGEDRILVNLDDVPDLLPAGLIAVEDRHFKSHFGISITSILRAVIADIRAGHVVQGGSTITQQLVKNFYLTSKRTFERKAREALMAILLEAHYSKSAIMEAYLNEVYLGQEGSRAIHGFGLASYFYFRKPLSELRPRGIALLVALVKGPSYYSPRSHPERARKRRNLVLDIFHDRGLIGDAAWQQARAADLGVSNKKQAATSRYPAFIDLVKYQLRGQYDHKDLTEEGLRIFTTLDLSVQSTIQQQVAAGLDEIEAAHNIKQGTLQSAAVVTSVEDAQVLGMVGSRTPGYAGYNRALNSRRLIGSTIKPVVYLAALQQPEQWNVLSPLDDSPISVRLPNNDIWQPQNYSRRSHGSQVPLYYALTNSYNLATVHLALDLGIPNIIDTLQALGYPDKPLAVPSLALGAVAMSPLQVAQLYNTIASGGYRAPLTAITAVTTADGEPLTRHEFKLRRTIDSGPNFLLTWILRQVARRGTGASAYNILPSTMEFAGKTGTSDGGRDAWFSGFTENRVVVVWTGNDDNKALNLTGATAALPIWAQIVAHIDANSLVPVAPDDVTTVPLRMEYAPGVAAQPGHVPAEFGAGCDNTTLVPFIEGYVPYGLMQCDSDIMSWNRKARQSELPADHAADGPSQDKSTSDEKSPSSNGPGWFKGLFR